MNYIEGDTMSQIPIEDAVEILETEGYEIPSYPKGITLEVPDTFTPKELYEMVLDIIEMAEEETPVQETEGILPIEINRFDKGGMDIVIPVKYIAPILWYCESVYMERDSDGRFKINSVNPSRTAMLGINTVIETGIKNNECEFMIDIDADHKELKKLIHSDELAHIFGEFEVQSSSDSGQPITIDIGDKRYDGYAYHDYSIKMPDLNLPTISVIPTQDFIKAVKGIYRMADAVTMSAYQNGTFTMDIDAYGDEDRNIDITFQDAVTKLPEDAIATAKFPMDDVSNITQILKKSKDTVEIHIGTDYPLDMRFKHGGVEYKLLIAPRVSRY